MINSLNFPLDNESKDAVGGWDRLKVKLDLIGCDGVEGIWAGTEVPADFPASLLSGYHLAFYFNWLDFYRGRKDIVYADYQNEENIKSAFGGLTPDCLTRTFREDIRRGIKLNTPYMVFHVSDVSFEESYTYRWRHSDEEVIDASAEILNDLLKGIEPSFDLLVENQWWPGFRFTDPKLTDRLLSCIDYPRKGIMLDTGHLMNCNLNIRNQAEGIKYIHKMLDQHGELVKYIKGMHFHQSVSGKYTKAHTGSLPENYPSEYLEQFSTCYGHILQIDRHMPWTDPDCVSVIDRIEPLYLTHEMSGGGKTDKFAKAKRQLHTIARGYADK